jgi:hypothetical protein
LWSNWWNKDWQGKPMIDEGDCVAVGGMKIGRGNPSTRRKPAPASLCPPQIPHDQTRARTPGRRGGNRLCTIP